MRAPRLGLAGLLVLALLTIGAPRQAAAAQEKHCRYLRLASMPATWSGSELVLPGFINETPVPMLLDSGATNIFIPERIAKALALSPAHGPSGTVSGIGGSASAWTASVPNLQVGQVKGFGVQATVANVDGPEVLIGADFLFQHDLELHDGRATWYVPNGCEDTSLAFWDEDAPQVPMVSTGDDDDRRILVEVRFNGMPLRALVDTGAPATILDLQAARRLHLAGVGNAADAQEIGGIGGKATRVWPARIDEFSIGPERVVHTRVLVGDLWGNQRAEMWALTAWLALHDAPEVILGADFLRAHHLLFAVSQRRLYFTYLGGEIFDMPAQSVPAPTAPAASAP